MELMSGTFHPQQQRFCVTAGAQTDDATVHCVSILLIDPIDPPQLCFSLVNLSFDFNGAEDVHPGMCSRLHWCKQWVELQKL